ncbi:MAG: class I SAM-dependent methyltransferase [Candidatus Dojkabacteria bacterium]|jgi:ubiquinone/menaquinone biosynthesis C-methylase UbiE|nr:class I SAM-dependent methyltransferase [Candidatus Dojkabacteria bacterium]
MNSKQKIKDSYNRNARNWTSKYSLTNYTHTHIEKPAIINLMGNVKNKRIICIGCGDGAEANMFYEKGAEVVGFDMSEKLINIAKEKYPNIPFYIGDAETFSIEETFDIAYAGFVAHYLPSYKKFLSNSSHLLKENGELIFSIIHPIKKILEVKKLGDRTYKILGSSKLDDGSCQETYGDYLNSREVHIKFGENFESINYHRTIGEQIKDILDSGFELLDFVEPKPIKKAEKEYPTKYATDCKIPEVLIYHLRKRGNK